MYQWNTRDQLLQGNQNSGYNWTLHIIGKGWIWIIYVSNLNFPSLVNTWIEVYVGFDGYNHILQKGPSVADTVIGEGNTTAWKMCGLDKSTCLTVMFDLSSGDRSNTPGAANPQLYLQFLTRLYWRTFINRTSYFILCYASFPILAGHWILMVMFLLQLPESRWSVGASCHNSN